MDEETWSGGATWEALQSCPKNWAEPVVLKVTLKTLKCIDWDGLESFSVPYQLQPAATSPRCLADIDRMSKSEPTRSSLRRSNPKWAGNIMRHYSFCSGGSYKEQGYIPH